MARQVALDVLADRDDPQLTRSRVIEGVTYECGRDALTLVLRRDLGVDEGDATVLDDVLEEPCELVAEMRLVAGALDGVRDDGPGGVGHGRDATRRGRKGWAGSGTTALGTGYPKRERSTKEGVAHAWTERHSDRADRARCRPQEAGRE